MKKSANTAVAASACSKGAEAARHNAVQPHRRRDTTRRREEKVVWCVLVCVLVRSIEKRPCVLKSFGLSLNGKSLMFVALGFLLGLIMYFGYFTAGSVFGQSTFTWSPVRLAILPFILVSLDTLANGFSEETAFRAYWQRLLVDRHGLWFGIILASASFVLLHLLITRLMVIALLAGILLACLFGFLYVWTDSIFLVGADWAERAACEGGWACRRAFG